MDNVRVNGLNLKMELDIGFVLLIIIVNIVFVKFFKGLKWKKSVIILKIYLGEVIILFVFVCLKGKEEVFILYCILFRIVGYYYWDGSGWMFYVGDSGLKDLFWIVWIYYYFSKRV